MASQLVTLLYQLFADDTNLSLMASEQNFQAAVEVISSYERISGARLNLEKSTIIPLDDEPLSGWYANTGCKVAHLEEIINYLGCPVGCKIPALKEVEYLLEKVRKRIFHWSNRLLSL